MLELNYGGQGVVSHYEIEFLPTNYWSTHLSVNGLLNYGGPVPVSHYGNQI